ncbi:laminin subunit beta-1 [Lasius niger]|uniref:Laminin subunit beta-1 n=1 Tax=Lasius niger TaxID=67767 RepID=A0A0J7N5I2_LASNI|nr:laminin subunit beta-1 [Lasius niger]
MVHGRCECTHNTKGLNCENCEDFYNDLPWKPAVGKQTNASCDCDLGSSLDDGICDSRTDPLSGNESGRCHCKANVEGRRCDRCKNGFWNFEPDSLEGCQACTCNTLGTVDNQGCNVVTGECTCKRYVTARDCNQCLPEYWGLSEDRDGCKPCDCDSGSS